MYFKNILASNVQKAYSNSTTQRNVNVDLIYLFNLL